MSNITSFKPKEPPPDTIWVCNCGCASFELCGDGAAKCRECGVSTLLGGWYDTIKGAVETTTEKPNYSDAGNRDDGILARRIALREAEKADWIICGQSGGRTVEWARIRMDEAGRAVLQDRINYGVKLLMEDLAK